MSIQTKTSSTHTLKPMQKASASSTPLPLKRKAVLQKAVLLEESGIVNESRYRTKTIPSAGSLLKEEDAVEKQQTFEV